jgi:FAD/FMN-containing dehydrogenase
MDSTGVSPASRAARTKDRVEQGPDGKGRPGDLLGRLDPSQTVVDPEIVAGFTTDWTGRFSGPAQAVVRPKSTEEVAEVLSACDAEAVPIVVQGGKTGLVGGSVPPPDPGPGPLPVVLSTVGLSEVGPVDEMGYQVTAGAGATLAAVQAAARAVGLEFPVDLAARDSATIGGMVGTNAGGLHVLRYGAMRAQVVGLEAVLADGRVLSRLSGLVKDNTGYDLSQLLVGSEGTLAVVTAARLRLVPRLGERAVALFGLGSMAAALELVAALRHRAEGLVAAEVFFDDGLELVCEHAGLDRPFSARRPVYVLAEVQGRSGTLDQLAGALDGLHVDDDATAVADDEGGAERLWAYRERHTEAVGSLGVPHKLDVTLPFDRLAAFESGVRGVVDGVCPGARTLLWGHVGDGNLHVNIVGPDTDDERADEAVLELVARYGGSISAEHGIGRAKARWIGLSRSPAELSVMRSIKMALDPKGILGPGVLFPGTEPELRR